MSAQHQHYVPKLLLRGFIRRTAEDEAKQQVYVMDLNEGNSFTTSIDNIMGERRFNDFWLDDETLATVEPAAGRIESHIAPLVERLRAEKRLERTLEEFEDLALLMAFQFIRTKKMRLLPERLNAQLRGHVERMGLDPTRVKGIENWDEEKLKKQHVRQQLDGIIEYTKIIAEKEFFIMTAPEGTSFYIGDHPVVLHNDDERRGRRGHLGIGVPYIQIYLPISSDVLLCAYCPAVFGQLMKGRDEEMAKGQSAALRALRDGKITADQMRGFVEGAKQFDLVTPLIDTIRAGNPVCGTPAQVVSYNALQVIQAHRFVIDPDGRFEVANEILAERRTANEG